MKLTAIWAALAAAPCLALASDPPTPLDPLVVTPSGHEVPASQTLAALIVIGRDEIARSLATDVAELLRFHAGVEVARTGGPGQTTSIFIRGGESNHTLVLIDGVRVNPASSGGAALQNIAPDMIERIEVVKGPRSTRYGSDALGGVINIITRAPAGPAAEARLRGGGADTRDGSAFLAQGGGEAGFALHAQSTRSDGIPSCAGSTADRAYQQNTLNLHGYQRLGAVKVSTQLWNAEGNAEYLDFCDALFGFNPQDQDFHNRVVATEGSWAWATGVDARLRASHMLDAVEQNQSADFVRTQRPALAFTQSTRLGDAHLLSVGLDGAREQVDASSFGSPVTEDRDVYGGHVQYELGAGAHHALLALAAAHHDAFGSPVTWNAEYGFDFASGTRLLAAGGSGFRAPDATDRFGFGGNPDLRAERARNYEVGARQRLGAAQLVELRAFRSDVSDLISVECVANCGGFFFDDVFLAQNVDRTRNDGLELSYRLELPAASLRLAALKQDPRAEARPDPCSGEARLCRRATESASASLVGRWGPAFAALDALGVGERVDFAGGRLPGYGLLGIGVGVELWRHWRVAARVENALDRAYQTAAGYDQPGRGFFVTLGAHL